MWSEVEGGREGGRVDNQELRMFWLDMEWELVGIAIGKLFKLAVAIVQRSKLSIFYKVASGISLDGKSLDQYSCDN